MRRPGALLVGSLATALALLVPTAPATADEEGGGDGAGRLVGGVDCGTAAGDPETVVRAREDSAPLVEMRIDEVHEEFSTGAGVGIAVIDSGIGTQTPYLLGVGEGEPQVTPSGDDQPELPGRPAVSHGTIVAGLIAGRRPGVDGEGSGMGIAPDADLYSIRIVGGLDSDEDAAVIAEDEFAAGDLVAGLDWVATNQERLDLRVVNLSLTAAPSDELEAAVRRVQEAGVVVVAATGNRGADEELPEDPFAAMPDDPDRYPAAYEGVVGVGAYVPRPTPPQQLVLSSEVVDVGATTVGAVSVVPGGSSCLLPIPATSWSTAYVSGALALLADVFEEETPEQLVARLTETATGVAGAPSRFVGAGLIQPYEAMTRELDPGRRGRVERLEREEETGAAPEPPARSDELADARDDFRWWGLLAGAVLVGAVIVRPLLRRARRS